MSGEAQRVVHRWTGPFRCGRSGQRIGRAEAQRLARLGARSDTLAVHVLYPVDMNDCGALTLTVEPRANAAPCTEPES